MITIKKIIVIILLIVTSILLFNQIVYVPNLRSSPEKIIQSLDDKDAVEISNLVDISDYNAFNVEDGMTKKEKKQLYIQNMQHFFDSYDFNIIEVASVRFIKNDGQNQARIICTVEADGYKFDVMFFFLKRVIYIPSHVSIIDERNVPSHQKNIINILDDYFSSYSGE